MLVIAQLVDNECGDDGKIVELYFCRVAAFGRYFVASRQLILQRPAIV